MLLLPLVHNVAAAAPACGGGGDCDYYMMAVMLIFEVGRQVSTH